MSKKDEDCGGGDGDGDGDGDENASTGVCAWSLAEIKAAQQSLLCCAVLRTVGERRGTRGTPLMPLSVPGHPHVPFALPKGSSSCEHSAVSRNFLMPCNLLSYSTTPRKRLQDYGVCLWDTSSANARQPVQPPGIEPGIHWLGQRLSLSDKLRSIRRANYLVSSGCDEEDLRSDAAPQPDKGQGFKHQKRRGIENGR